MTLLSTVSDFLVVFFGLYFLLIAFVNFFGTCHFMGRTGAIFVYEMDAIMGGLLDVPSFSKYEGTLMLLSSLSCLQALRRTERKHLWIALGLLVTAVYFLLCVAYAVFAGQPLAPFIAFTAGVWLLTIWRITAFLKGGQYVIVGCTFAVAMLAVMVGVRRMKQRVHLQEELIQRYIRIQRYCEQNPQFTWVGGEDAPAGFA